MYTNSQQTLSHAYMSPIVSTTFAQILHIFSFEFHYTSQYLLISTRECSLPRFIRHTRCIERVCVSSVPKRRDHQRPPGSYHRDESQRSRHRGTPTFIVTNDTAVNSPLTPRGIEQTRQRRDLVSRPELLPRLVHRLFSPAVVSLDKCSGAARHRQ